MKVLIIGSNGQLGQSLKENFDNFNNLLRRSQCQEIGTVFVDKDELDITDKKAVTDFFNNNGFNYCINCAAYTNVNKAEEPEERDAVYALNSYAPKLLAEICRMHNIKFVHISTDYVFGNSQPAEIKTEGSLLEPLNIYGQSKVEGEYNVQDEITKGLDAIIIRTSWLYSKYGSNFVKTVLNKAKNHETLEVVFDQVGTPTCADDLAHNIMMIAANDMVNRETSGLYHYSNEGVCSWFDFAKAIVDISGYSAYVLPKKTEEDCPVRRPVFSVLDKTKIKTVLKAVVPYWMTSLKKTVEQIKKEIER